MIDLYLDSVMREQILNYDIEHSEQNYDNLMYYIQNSESQVLYDIIFGVTEKDLEKFGFKNDDIKLIMESDVNIKFTNKNNYYIKRCC